MVDYAKKIIESFSEKNEKMAYSLAGDHLFQIRDKVEAQLLKEERAMSFHHAVAQLLFLSGKVRGDI